jgi:2-keto-4-pentenoate hydratase
MKFIANIPAKLYIQSWVSNSPINQILALPPTQPTIDEIYKVHDEMIALAASDPFADAFSAQAGYKMGAIGMIPNVPCLCGPLFTKFISRSNATGKPLDVDAAFGGTTTHLLEGEIGFIMKRNLPAPVDGSAITISDLWESVEFVVPCIEICGNRFSQSILKGGELKLGDKLADGLMCAGVVTGTPISKARIESYFGSSCELIDSRLNEIIGTLLVNGKVINEGTGSNCPEGGPLSSLCWLANHLTTQRGTILKAGEIVISGAICKTSAFNVGMGGVPDHLVVDFGPFVGRVERTIVRGGGNTERRSKL